MTATPDPAVLEHEARPRAASSLPRREKAVEAVSGAVFLAVALAFLMLGSGTVRVDVLIGLVVAFAVAVRAQFDVGGGYVPPTQLVFVSALLLEPPRVAPWIALAGFVLGRLPDVARGTLHPSRLLLLPADCLYTLGPVAVLALAGTHGPDWGDWPVYIAALAAQFALDLAAGSLRAWLALGVPPGVQLRTVAFVWSIDAALAPVGLLAAFASTSWRFAFLGVLPLAGLLVLLSHERTRRLASELAATRDREALIAGASHELQTPLAILSGLLATLVRDPAAPPERRAQSYGAMSRQAAHLRYLVGQFVDYATIKAGQELPLALAPVAVEPLLRSVAELWSPDVTIDVDAAGNATAMADEARLHRVVMSLVANAVRHGPPEGPVALSVRRAGSDVVVEVADRGPGIPEAVMDEAFAEFRPASGGREGIGVGLFLARAGLRAQGGDIAVRNQAGGGVAAELRLPAA